MRTAQAQYRELTVLDEEIRDTSVRMTRDRVARAKSGLEAGEVRLRRAKFDLQRTVVRPSPGA